MNNQPIQIHAINNMQSPTDSIYQWLESNDIDYIRHDHVPVFTVEEAETVEKDIPGVKAKTLLVFGEKTKKLYLVSLEGHKKLEQSRMKELVSERVRFGTTEDLERILRVTPGSVSPLGLIFDTQLEIHSHIVDKDVYDADIVTWHPNDNSQTLEFTHDMYHKILDLLPHSKMLY